MLLIESFEEATDLILEGIDRGDIRLIIEGSKRFKEAVKTYTELIDKTREQFASAPVLSQTIDEFLKEIETGIETLERGSDKRGFKVTSKWSNLLKLKSPWEAGKSNMAELSMFAAKLDILSRGMLEAVKMVIKMVRNYEGIFIVNNEGVAIKPDSQVNPELKLSDIAGLEGKELIEKLISPKAGESSERDDEDEDKEVTPESIRFNDDLLLTELLGMGGASNDELKMVYKSFPNLCDEIDGDKLKQAKELYGYFKKLADDTETLFEEITKMLVKLEPTSELQNLVKQSDSSWIKKLFTTPKYKINKEEAKKLAGKKGILSVKMSEFSTIVQNLVSGMKKNAPAETVKQTEEEAKTEETNANDQIEDNKNLNQANQDVEELSDSTGVSPETLTTVLHSTEGDTNSDATTEALEEEGVGSDQAPDVAAEIEDTIEDDAADESSDNDSTFEAPEMKLGRVKTALGNSKNQGLNQPARSAIAKGLEKLELVKLIEAYDPGKSLDQVIKDLLEILPKLDLKGKEKSAIQKIISVYEKPSSPAREKLKALLQDEIKYQLGGESGDAENDDKGGYKEDLLKGYSKKWKDHMKSINTDKYVFAFDDDEVKKIPTKKKMKAVMEKEKPTENGLIPKEKLDSDKISKRYPKSPQEIATDIGIAESIDMERWLKLAGILKD